MAPGGFDHRHSYWQGCAHGRRRRAAGSESRCGRSRWRQPGAASGPLRGKSTGLAPLPGPAPGDSQADSARPALGTPRAAGRGGSHGAAAAAATGSASTGWEPGTGKSHRPGPKAAGKEANGAARRSGVMERTALKIVKIVLATRTGLNELDDGITRGNVKLTFAEPERLKLNRLDFSLDAPQPSLHRESSRYGNRREWSHAPLVRISNA
jgi:hypothetical protein